MSTSQLGNTLWEFGFRTREELNSMSYEDRRNTLIVELDKVVPENIPTIQGWNSAKLITKINAYIPDVILDVRFGRKSFNAAKAKPVAQNSINVKTKKVQQSVTLKIDKSVQTTRSFSHTHGISIKAGTEFEAGVPFVGSAKVSIEVTASTSFTWGNTKTDTTHIESSNTYTIAPNSPLFKATATAVQYKIDIPYNIKFKRGRKQHENSGVWKGCIGFDTFYE
eukprot:322313_1